MEATGFIFPVIMLLPQLVGLAACIYYLLQKITLDGILLLIGSTGGILIYAFHLFILPYLLNGDTTHYTDHTYLLTVSSIIGFITSISFSAGLFILIYNHTQKAGIPEE